MGSEDPKKDLERENDRLRAENAELREQVLDLEDALGRLESQHEVLENFLFGLEQDHEKARSLVTALKEDQDEIFETVTQGILTVNSDGTINPGYSRATGQILERGDLAGTSFVDLLPEGSPLRSKLERYLQLQFATTTKQTMLNRLNPMRSYSHRVVREDGSEQTKALAISFARIWQGSSDDDERSVRKVLVVIDDQTTEHELNRELEQRTKEQARKVETAYQILMLPPAVFADFVKEAEDGLGAVERLLVSGDYTPAIHRECARAVHTLKGSASALNLDQLEHAVHKVEDRLADLPDAAPDDLAAALERVLEGIKAVQERVRDGSAMLDKVLDMRAALRVTDRGEERDLERTLRNLIEAEAESSGKQVALDYRDDIRTQLPRHVLFRFKNALIQLVRNSVAHGIEPPSERSAAGKPACGTIAIRLSETEDELRIESRDDGAGIDAEAIRARAIERGLIGRQDVEELDMAQALELIFLPGFSTASRVTELSGRGVGMDVVSESAAALGGHVRVHTEVGAHTRFVIELPKRVALTEPPDATTQEHDQ